MPAIDHRVRQQFIICLFLIIVTLLLYHPVGQFEFINYDDPGYVYQNRWVRSGLNWAGVEWAFISFELSNWHPFTWMSHMLDVTLYGLNPGAHHWTNVQLHILNTILLFLVMLRMTDRIWKCGLLAALFAIHPLHIESVAWVSERKDVLSAFFFMLTLWCYTGYVKRPSLIRYLLVLVIFFCGLMAKPMLVTLPFILLLLDYWPLNRFSNSDRSESLNINPCRTSSSRYHVGFLLLEKVPLMTLAGISCIFTLFAQHQGNAVSSLNTLPVMSRISNAFVSYVTYIYKLLLPLNLSILYPYPDQLPVWKITCSALILIVVFLLIFFYRTRKPYLPTGLLWFFGMLIPVIGLVQVGSQSMADRYTYLPSIGFFVATIWSLSELFNRLQNPKLLSVVSSVMALGCLGLITAFQLPHWKNSIELFEHALSNTEKNFVAHHNLGEALAAQNRLPEAYHHFMRALQINSELPLTHFNIGLYHQKYGNLALAIYHYQETIRLQSDHFKAYTNLGIIYLRKNQPDKSLKLLSEAVSIHPELKELYLNWGIALAKYNLNLVQFDPEGYQSIYDLATICQHFDKSEEIFQYFIQGILISKKSIGNWNPDIFAA